MEPILVPCVDGSTSGLRYACASSKGTLYLAYDGDVLELHPTGETTAVSGFERIGTKRLKRTTTGFSRIRMVAEGPNGVLYVSDRKGVRALRDGRIDTIIEKDAADNDYYIKFLRGGNMIAFDSRGYVDLIREYSGDALVGEVQTLERPRDGSRLGSAIHDYGTEATIFTNWTIKTECAVEGDFVDAALATSGEWPFNDNVMSATVFGGTLYHVGANWPSRGTTLYKNRKPFLQLPIGERCQLTSHPSSGLYVVQGDRVSRVILNPKWSAVTHRHFNDGVRKAIKATMMVRGKSDRGLERLPMDMLREIFNWIVR